MSINAYADHRKKTAAIQARLDAEVASIRDNPNYTTAGRRAELAKAALKAKQETAALHANVVADRTTRTAALARKLFGPGASATPTEVALWRDSQDRAAKLTLQKDALESLNRAMAVGDTAMAKAIAEQAHTKGWSEALAAYRDNAPYSAGTALDELTEIPTGPNAADADGIVFRIRPPHELGAANDALLQSYANDTADAQTAAAPMGNWWHS